MANVYKNIQAVITSSASDDDVNDSNTDTKREHIRRDVHLKIAQIKLGADTGEL